MAVPLLVATLLPPAAAALSPWQGPHPSHLLMSSYVLLAQLQEVCNGRAASLEAAEPGLDGVCRDLAVSSFMCCAAGCTNLAGVSDTEVELSKCTGCKTARYCSRYVGRKARLRAWWVCCGFVVARDVWQLPGLFVPGSDVVLRGGALL